MVNKMGVATFAIQSSYKVAHIKCLTDFKWVNYKNIHTLL